MAKAQKLPYGNWRCLVYDHSEPVLNPDSTPALDKEGRPKQKRIYESFTADTRKEAEYLAAEFALNKKQMKTAKNWPVKTAVENYIAAKENILSPTTITSYKSMHKRYFATIDNLKLTTLTQSTVQAWINDISKKVSPKTVRNVHSFFASVIDMYCPDFHLKTTLPQKQKVNLYVPSDSDIVKLLRSVTNRDLEIAIYLAAFGPLRRGEICAATSDDLNGVFLTINKAMVLSEQKEWIVRVPKTYSSNRTIELPAFVVNRLQGIKGNLVKLNPDMVTHRFKNALKHAGLPHFRFGFPPAYPCNYFLLFFHLFALDFTNILWCFNRFSCTYGLNYTQISIECGFVVSLA